MKPRVRISPLFDDLWAARSGNWCAIGNSEELAFTRLMAQMAGPCEHPAIVSELDNDLKPVGWHCYYCGQPTPDRTELYTPRIPPQPEAR